MNNKYDAASPLFTKEELKRAIIRWHTKMWLWVLPTHIQICDEGMMLYYKHWGNKYYLMKIEKIG